MLERLDLPATVIGSSFSPIGQALINRLAIKDDIDEHTMVVIFSDNSGCSTETYEQAMKVYDRGGVIVFDNPSPDKAEAAELYAYNNHGDKCYVSDNSKSMSRKQDPNDSTKMIEYTDNRTFASPTAYDLGLIADGVVQWIEENVKIRSINYARVASSAEIEAQTETFYHIIPERFTGENRRALYKITYSIKALHSFSKNADYYIVHEEIIGNNSPMWGASFSENGYKCTGFCLGAVGCEHKLQNKNQQNLSIEQAILHDPRPTGTESSSSYSSGVSFSLSGNVGCSPSGLSGAIMPGVSISESYSTSIPDVKIVNRCLSKPRDTWDNTDVSTASWLYDVKKRQAYTDWFKVKVRDAPNVATSTIILHNCWYWEVPNPNPNDTLYMDVYNHFDFYYSALKTGFGYRFGNEVFGNSCSKEIKLTAPNRKLN